MTKIKKNCGNANERVNAAASTTASNKTIKDRKEVTMKKNAMEQYAAWLYIWTKKIMDVEGHIKFEMAKSLPDKLTIEKLEEHRAWLYKKLNQSVRWYADKLYK